MASFMGRSMGWSSMAEIGFDHGGIGAYFFGLAHRQHPAFGHHHDPRTQRHDEFHIVFDDHEGRALLAIDGGQALPEVDEHGEVDAPAGSSSSTRRGPPMKAIAASSSFC